MVRCRQYPFTLSPALKAVIGTFRLDENETVLKAEITGAERSTAAATPALLKTPFSVPTKTVAPSGAKASVVSLRLVSPTFSSLQLIPPSTLLWSPEPLERA